MSAAEPPPPAPPAAPMAPQRRVLCFEGADPATDRADLSVLCAQYGEVAFVDFRFGETVGYVRFRSEEAAKEAAKALPATSGTFSGLKWRLLEAEEVRSYKRPPKHQHQEITGSTETSVNDPRADRRGPAAPRPVEESGVVLNFQDASPNTDRGELSALCSHYGDVAYVDFRFGSTSGFVRFRNADGARRAVTALAAGTTVLGDATPSWRLLSAEEEVEYRQSVQSRKRSRDESTAAGQACADSAAGGSASNPSAVLHVDGVSSAATREQVSTVCSSYAEVAFVDFRSGETAGYVRFRTTEAAATALAALSGSDQGGLGGDGAAPLWRQLTIAEARAYRNEVETAKRQRMQGMGGGEGPGRGRGRFGGGGGGRALGRRGRLAL